MSSTVDHLIIGAGLSGLAAASALRSAGRSVLVLDKGRGLGGRLANRRFEGAVFDHGAQFFTARDPKFIAQVERWRKSGVVVPWYEERGETKWRGAPTMTALAHALADDLPIRRSIRVSRIARGGNGWQISCDDRSMVQAHSVILTTPSPQALELLSDDSFSISDDILGLLGRFSYHRCIAVMACLTHPSALPPPGIFRSREGPISWIADNQLKGISPTPSVTIHASPEFSKSHWNEDREEAGTRLLKYATPILKTEVSAFQTHGWKFSQPKAAVTPPSLLVHQSPALTLAGDGFTNGRVEGAVLSGWDAARNILDAAP